MADWSAGLTDQAQHKTGFASPGKALAVVVTVALALAAALALLLGAGMADPAYAETAGTGAATPGPPAAMGANTGVLFNSHRYTRAQIDAQLAALARTGATVVRSDALWETAEPKAPLLGLIHQYDWSQDDLIVGSLAAHGLRWLPIIDYSATWDESVPGDDHSPPASPAAYESYAGAVAARYGPGGTFWHDNSNLTPLPVDTYEIWNEPDSHYFWHPTPDPSAYANLYTGTRAAITTVQPAAHVIIGGLTSPSAFLSSLLQVDPGIEGQIDGVAIHPYGPTPERVLDNVRATRLAMNADSLSIVPIYVTEFGWTTQPAKSHDWVSAQLRPGYVQRALAGLGHTDCGIAAVLLYAWATPDHDPSNSEDWYGISPPGATASPDTSAFAAGLHQATTGPVNPLCSGPSPLAAPHKVLLRPRRPRPRVARRKHRHRPHHRPAHHRGGLAER